VTLAHDRLGRGEPLLLLHGIGSERGIWEPVVDRLAAERDVIAPDMPGFGESPPLPPETTPDAAALARAVAAFLDELGLDTVHTAGNSLGGWVSLELAKLGRARSVTALAPAGLWDKRPAVSTFTLGLQRLLTRTFRPLLPLALGTPLGRRIALRRTFARPERVTREAALRAARAYADAPGFPATFRAVNRTHFSGGRELRVPVTVVWGDKEQLLRAPRARRRDELPEHASVVVLEGCGHVPMWDDPEQTARVLLEGSAAPQPAATR
jgi:pimeloyl-ACP methyl ester carboxylesterase